MYIVYYNHITFFTQFDSANIPNTFPPDFMSSIFFKKVFNLNFTLAKIISGETISLGKLAKYFKHDVWRKLTYT